MSKGGEIKMVSEERKAELKAKLDNGEIDIYDYNDEVHDYFGDITSWTCSHYDDNETDNSTTHEKNKELDNVPKFFLVKIRISNGRTYQVAKVQIQNLESMEEEETELFNHYYKKLNKRHLHIQKPRHRVFRTAIIDELYIDVSES